MPISRLRGWHICELLRNFFVFNSWEVKRLPSKVVSSHGEKHPTKSYLTLNSLLDIWTLESKSFSSNFALQLVSSQFSENLAQKLDIFFLYKREWLETETVRFSVKWSISFIAWHQVPLNFNIFWHNAILSRDASI